MAFLLGHLQDKVKLCLGCPSAIPLIAQTVYTCLSPGNITKRIPEVKGLWIGKVCTHRRKGKVDGSFKKGLKKYKSVDVRGYCVLCLSFKNNTLFSLQPLRLLVGQEGSKPVKVFGASLK